MIPTDTPETLPDPDLIVVPGSENPLGDLAAVAGRTVETATARYTHALGRSDDRTRQGIG